MNTSTQIRDVEAVGGGAGVGAGAADEEVEEDEGTSATSAPATTTAADTSCTVVSRAARVGRTETSLRSSRVLFSSVHPSIRGPQRSPTMASLLVDYVFIRLSGLSGLSGTVS